MSTRYLFIDNLTYLSKVNSRHSELLTFHHLKPRTDAYKFPTIVRFPKMFSELTIDTRNIFILEGYKSFRMMLREDLLVC